MLTNLYIVSASYPHIFFPCISSTDECGKVIFGEQAYEPEIRTNGLHHPVASCKEIDTVSYIRVLYTYALVMWNQGV